MLNGTNKKKGKKGTNAMRLVKELVLCDNIFLVVPVTNHTINLGQQEHFHPFCFLLL